MKSTILDRVGFPHKRGLLTVILALASWTTPSLCAEPLSIRIESGRIAESLDDQPAAVSLVERPAGQAAAPAADLGELLVGVPGVFTSARANAAQDLRLSIRGFGARGNFGIRGVRLLVDGFPATLPDGQSTVDDIDPALIERVEVRRGPAASLYGPAAGGVVSFSTRPAFGTPGSRLTLGGGSRAAASAHLRHDRIEGGISLQADLSTREQSGYREHAAQRHRYLNVRLTRRDPAGGRLEAVLAALESPFARDPGGLSASERDRDRRAAGALNLRFDTGERVEQRRIGLRYTRPIGRGELEFSGYLLRRDFANRLPFSATRLDRTAGGLSLQLERRGRPLGPSAFRIPWRWLAGLDLDQQRDDRRRFDNDDGRVGARTAAQDERVTALGVFAQLQLEPSPDITLRLGLRGDRVGFRLSDRFLLDGDQSGERVFRRLSPALGLSWRGSERFNLYARITRAFETPTTTELADPGGAGGFNPAVEPQASLGLETGLRWRSGPRWSGELALFDTRVDDQLVPLPIAGQPERFYYVNAASARYRGVELALETRLGERWRVAASGTLARYRFDEFRDADGHVFDGRRVPGLPEYRLGLSLDYRPGPATEVSLGLRRVGSRAVDNANSERAAAYTLVDLRADHALPGSGGRLRLGLGIDNLFNAEYEDNVRINAAGGRFYEPAAGRSFSLTLSAEL